MRVGQRVDYERLLLEIWTTGAITPKDAVKHATEILNKHFNLIAETEAEEVKKPRELPGNAGLVKKSLSDKPLPRKTKKIEEKCDISEKKGLT